MIIKKKKIENLQRNKKLLNIKKKKMAKLIKKKKKKNKPFQQINNVFLQVGELDGEFSQRTDRTCPDFIAFQSDSVQNISDIFVGGDVVSEDLFIHDVKDMEM